MFLRGGLLIEPWKPYKSYTNDPRIQDVVLYDNTIYVCSVSHISGATFSENANKFISAGSGGSSGGSGGGSGGSSGGYAGEWDLNTSVVVTPPAIGNLSFDTYVSSAPSGSSTSFVNTNPGTPLPGISIATLYGANISNVVGNFTGTRWVELSLPVYHYCLVYLLNDDVSISDIPTLVLNDLISSTVTYDNYALLLLFRGDDFITRCTLRGNSDSTPFITTPVDVDSVTDNARRSFKVGINKTGNEIIIVNEENNTTIVSSPEPLLDFTKIFITGIVIDGSLFTGGLITLSSLTDVGRLPLQSVSAGTVIIPPQSSQDGDIWSVANSGIYNDISLVDGDIVLFYNNRQNLVKLVDKSTEISQPEINNLINTAITKSVNTGAIKTAIATAINNIPPADSIDYQTRTYYNPLESIYFYDNTTDTFYNNIEIGITDGQQRYMLCYFNTGLNFEGKGIFRVNILTNGPTEIAFYSEIGTLISSHVLDLEVYTAFYFTNTGNGTQLLSAQKRDNNLVSIASYVHHYSIDSFPAFWSKGLQTTGFSNSVVSSPSFGMEINNSLLGEFGTSKIAMAYLNGTSHRFTTGFDMIIQSTPSFEKRGVIYSTEVLGGLNVENIMMQRILSGNPEAYLFKIETGGTGTTSDQNVVNLTMGDQYSTYTTAVNLTPHAGVGPRRLRISVDIIEQILYITDIDTLEQTRVIDFYFYMFETIFQKNRSLVGVYNTIDTSISTTFTNTNLNIIESRKNGNRSEPLFSVVSSSSDSAVGKARNKPGVLQLLNSGVPSELVDSYYWTIFFRDEHQWVDYGTFMYNNDVYRPRICYNDKIVPTEIQFHKFTTGSLRTTINVKHTTRVLKIHILDGSSPNMIVLLPFLIGSEYFLDIEVIGGTVNLSFTSRLPANLISSFSTSSELNGTYPVGTYKFRGRYNMGIVSWRII